MLRETANRHFHASKSDHLFGGDVPCCRLERSRLGRVKFGCSEANIAESLQETPLALQGALSRDRGQPWFGHTYVLVCIHVYWYVLIGIDPILACTCTQQYRKPQYGQIRTKHIYNHVNTRKYIPQYGQICTQYIPIPPVLAPNLCAKRSINTYQNIPNTYQFVQIHTKIHTNTGYS
jgi:hypothetical protein